MATLRARKVRAGDDLPRLAATIDEASAMLGVSYMTLWRAIRENQFPGLHVRGRIVVPLKAVDLLLESALQSGQLVDAASWTANWQVTGTPARRSAREIDSREGER